jgi:geranylgeranyl pyrophosphate synthase
MKANGSDTDQLLEQHLDEVRKLMAGCLAETPLHSALSDCKNLFGTGKMLRSRLTLRVGPAAGVAYSTILRAAAAIELIHAASLLHDDVIDGGFLRRGAPAFWVDRGIPAAILLGDLLLFKALELVTPVENGRLLPVIIKLTGEVCEAESEQELVTRGKLADWDTCVQVARRKTGGLFAFAAHACGGDDPELSAALQEAGYLAGTAYQLADDILDANGDAESAGKTLGRDEARDKTTAARVKTPDNIDPVKTINDLLASARAGLDPWPAVRAAWDAYMARDMRPAIEKSLAPLSPRSKV